MWTAPAASTSSAAGSNMTVASRPGSARADTTRTPRGRAGVLLVCRFAAFLRGAAADLAVNLKFHRRWRDDTNREEVRPRRLRLPAREGGCTPVMKSPTDLTWDEVQA